ncbi:MAG TPA: alternative ribosome rescue aminoacyl-tRNA hydrolase ArfB [Woeseiaceae bacterium]|jgi:ribosome-associated protein|nr:alternative ribosome rescue aminoacyl-tRNA hydrolase ArfB [Woeseiaceae bacterium]
MTEDVIISDEIVIPGAELELHSIRSQGAGGQNVNKVASAIHLRFDIGQSASLPERIKARLMALEDRRITADGVLVIKSQEHRNRERNRRAALDRLRELVQSVLAEPEPRKKTAPSRRARQERVDAKRRRGELKKTRGRLSDD